MGKVKADEILESIDREQSDKIILEIESLKPWKYTWIIENIIRAVLFGYIILYMQEDSVFMETKFILLVLVSLLFSSSHSDNKVHKRIDALVHLINCNAMKNKSS